MHRLHKPGIMPPEGRHKFSAILESQNKPEYTSIRAFLLHAHKYGEEKLGSALMGVLRRPQGEISAEVSEAVYHPVEIIFNTARRITDVCELEDAANAFVIGRNALIPYYLTSEQFLPYFFRPYQEVCEALIPEKNTQKKCEYLSALGVLGNLLPKGEKSKLVDFVISVLDSKSDLDVKGSAAHSLSLLLSPKAAFPLMRSAENADFEFETAAYKAALLTSVFGERALPLVLPCFLFGNYSTETKLDAASLMLSFGNPMFEHYINVFVKDVSDTYAILATLRISDARAARNLAQYFAETGLSRDVEAAEELGPYSKLEVDVGWEC